MDSDQRAREADYLHRHLFGGPAPAALCAAYAQALETLFPGDLERPAIDMTTLIERRLDPQAVELYLRLRLGGPSTLTQRLHVLLYLAELQPEHRSRFVLDRPARPTAWIALARAGLVTTYQLGKGWLQVTRHGLLPAAHHAA